MVQLCISASTLEQSPIQIIEFNLSYEVDAHLIQHPSGPLAMAIPGCLLSRAAVGEMPRRLC